MNLPSPTPLAVKGSAASAIAHVCALLVLVGIGSHRLREEKPTAPGERDPLPLEVDVARPETPDADPPSVQPFVVVEATRAQVGDRTFSQRPTDFSDELAPRLEPGRASERPPLSANPEPTSPPSPPARFPTRQRTALQSAGAGERVPPTQIFNVPPIYPRVALDRGWHGTVLLRLFIDSAGRVDRVEIARSSGHPVLDAAAKSAAQQWRFHPATIGSRPAPTVETKACTFLPRR